MTTAIDKSTIISNIYKNFYDLVVAISGFTSIVYPTFPDVVKDSKDDYPIVIINSPEIDWSTFTFGKGIVEGEIMVDIYTNTPSETDSKASAVSNKIETSKYVLAQVGLKDINLSRTSSDNVNTGKIKIFIKSLPFTFKYYYTKTGAF